MSGAIRWDSDKECKLSKIDPSIDGGYTEETAKAKFALLSTQLSELQELMYAASTHSVLTVFQGMDTGGKDGAIRNVMGALNPAGCSVTSFKIPSSLEASHDFLWRIHNAVPPKGHVSVFNRSHYEDVLVARVHDLVPKNIWKKRYDHIVNFEKMLIDSDTIVLKFFLYISKDEQKIRLMKREQQAEKSWKLSVADWKERELWNDYMKAYEEAISKTSTEDTPWYIIPANHKWYRDVIISEAIIEALKPYKSIWKKKLDLQGEAMKAQLAELHIHEPVTKSTASKPIEK
jgi:PPK2 family polyphosphate:nucleotide phosphotransferase